MKHKKSIRKNPAGLIAAFLVATSAFLSPLASAQLFGVNFADRSLVMANQMMNLFSNPLLLRSGNDLVGLSTMVTFGLVFLFYLVNGLGLAYNRWSRRASYLSFVYFLLAAYYISLANQSLKLPLFGSALASVGIGPGVWAIPAIGILYLLLHRAINENIRF